MDKNDIIEWLIIDNNIKSLNEKLKTYRKKRKYLAKNICDNLDNQIIKINDEIIKKHKNKYVPPITLTYIEDCLSNFIHDENSIKIIMEYIKIHRPYKYDYDIKRYHNN